MLLHVVPPPGPVHLLQYCSTWCPVLQCVQEMDCSGAMSGHTDHSNIVEAAPVSVLASTLREEDGVFADNLAAFNIHLLTIDLHLLLDWNTGYNLSLILTIFIIIMHFCQNYFY